MAWKHRYPRPEDFDTEEEYIEACEAYETAEDEYADEYVEQSYARRNGNEI